MPQPATRRETSAGGVVVRCGAEGLRYLLIHDTHGNWGFPKGHLDPGEGPEEAARREVGEEVGLTTLVLHAPLGIIDWHFRFRGRRIHKFCHFFLFESAHGDPVPQTEEGITSCRWYIYDDARRRLRFANARAMLRAAHERATSLCGEE
jgi:8-oxo-dGTP pyrophosphatase MutT (NUDIX family)